MKLKLTRPTQINGSELTELNLDLENLKGKDLMELETGFRRRYRGEYVPVLNIDSRYQAHVAGRVCGINPDDLGELYAPDFAAMCAEIQNFLLSGGLVDDEGEESVGTTVMKVCLSMSTNFHTPVDFWLGLTLPELYEWVSAAKSLSEERSKG